MLPDNNPNFPKLVPFLVGEAEPEQRSRRKSPEKIEPEII
jgi:hypothetical protein